MSSAELRHNALLRQGFFHASATSSETHLQAASLEPWLRHH
ncbi:hypothetical protein SynMITS9220_01961 [Synechococcus sp. MIT S9220]|nr:hypothetical protein SynMITS9220_01961 [Synechococcus sp. MIT S9220]